MSVKYTAFSFLYKTLFKPIAFQIDPEVVHDMMTWTGERLENQKTILSGLFAYQHPSLKKKVLGMTFDNPIGLAAGFDYDGHLAQVMKHVGFGFNTVGTVTAGSYEGNPKPRLGRLPKSKSLLVNKGFKSEGADKIAARLDKKKLNNHTVGISIGSTNSPKINTISKAVDDYLYTFELFKNRKYVKYFELNISCPNTAFPESFVISKNFEQLVKAISKVNLRQPIFVKMPNELGNSETGKIISTALKYGIQGFIFSNLVKDRKNPALDLQEIKKFEDKKGNFSGKPTFNNSNSLIAYSRKKFGKDIAIIGCGGVFGYEDAMTKFASGADLVQLITGMIFQGPQIAGEICTQLIS